jgi:hypothetical protein
MSSPESFGFVDVDGEINFNTARWKRGVPGTHRILASRCDNDVLRRFVTAL